MELIELVIRSRIAYTMLGHEGDLRNKISRKSHQTPTCGHRPRYIVYVKMKPTTEVYLKKGFIPLINERTCTLSPKHDEKSVSIDLKNTGAKSM